MYLPRVVAASLSLGAIALVAGCSTQAKGEQEIPAQGELDRAWQTTWQEETTRQVTNYVPDEQVYCQYANSNCAAVRQVFTVPGPVVARTGHVCARTVEEARSMVASEVTITGHVADSINCNQTDAEPDPPMQDGTESAEEDQATLAAPNPSSEDVWDTAHSLTMAVGYCYAKSVKYPISLAATRTCQSDQPYPVRLPNDQSIACWESTGRTLIFAVVDPWGTYACYDSTAGDIREGTYKGSHMPTC
jgi:hypothetical protein